MKINACKMVSGAIIVACLVVLAGCGEKAEEDVAVAAPVDRQIPVVIETASKGDLQELFTLPVVLEAWEDLTIAAEVSGVVERIYHGEGDPVAAGISLADIDSKTIISSLNRDQSAVEVLKSKLTRYQQLLSEGLVSQQEFDDLENSLTAAEAALQATRIQLANSKPTAPVRGIVDHVFVDRGEFVDRGNPILRLVQVDRLKALANVPEKDVPFLRKGQQVRLEPAEILSEAVGSCEGDIEYIAFAADEATRTYRTRITLDNKDLRLRPGMIMRATFVRRRLSDVVSVPLFAVIDRDGHKSLFVKNGDAAKEVSVTIGASIGDRVVVKEGLAEGQQVVVKGQQLLIDGTAITVRGE